MYRMAKRSPFVFGTRARACEQRCQRTKQNAVEVEKKGVKCDLTSSDNFAFGKKYHGEYDCSRAEALTLCYSRNLPPMPTWLRHLLPVFEAVLEALLGIIGG